MSMTRKFSLGLLGAVVAVMLTSPQAATQTAQQGEAATRRYVDASQRHIGNSRERGASRRICSVRTCTRPAWLMRVSSRKDCSRLQ